MNATIAHCVTPFTSSEFIKNPVGESYRILFFADDGKPGFEHRCDRGDRGVIICAPRLDSSHHLAWAPNHADKEGRHGQRLTITPSIHCPDCGIHGFVREGMWVAA